MVMLPNDHESILFANHLFHFSGEVSGQELPDGIKNLGGFIPGALDVSLAGRERPAVDFRVSPERAFQLEAGSVVGQPRFGHSSQPGS